MRVFVLARVGARGRATASVVCIMYEKSVGQRVVVLRHGFILWEESGLQYVQWSKIGQSASM